MSITVVNGYKDGFCGQDKIYIGRGGKGKKGSPLANPYQIGADGSREEVFALYKDWLVRQVDLGNVGVVEELERIANLAKDSNVKLVCFCSPKPCHGEIIKEMIENGEVLQ